MNSFLNPHNDGPSLTGVIDATAHSISLFQENGPPKHIIDIFTSKSDLGIALPYDVQTGELGKNVITMCQSIGPTNDETLLGLESLLDFMTENFFTKGDPAINEHQYHITKQQYNEEIHNIYNIDKTKHLILRPTAFLTEQYFNKNKM